MTDDSSDGNNGRVLHFIDVCYIDSHDEQTHYYSWEQLQDMFDTNSILLQQIIGLKRKSTCQIIIDFDEGLGEVIIWESQHKEHS